MSIIISREGKNAQKLDRTSIAQEDYLQGYIYDNPESLPLYEISEDLRLLILAREFPTNSGPVDALGIDQEGRIYVIETKLYKNPDKRLVLAQVLDYGASLWRTYEDDDEFIARLESAVGKTFKVTLTERIVDFYGTDAETAAAMLQNVRQNLNNGSFRFVVLMDRLADRLKDLITYVNQNSRFDIFGVELEFYKFQEYEILIPKLYGAEVKKDVGGAKVSGPKKKWDEESFFAEAGKYLDSERLRSLRELYSFSKEAGRVTWGVNLSGSFNAKFDQIHKWSLYTVYSNGDLDLNFGWLSDNEVSAAVAERLGQELGEMPGFNIPGNYREKHVPVTVDVWVPQVDELIRAIRTATGSVL
jgi:hypothetical protein